ncbi:MAG: 50S ribosomal protein L6 [Elusimicrobia bacterium]|nr:50S ribosomal protein L6 [Elusimicrobiota bacterium]MBI3012360.1 50S ribosomal protein L6 [Elusimicrobiota bacterium]MBI4218332.1 50S ribosomal protein L6 [Elusimicrobiota bacterium]
MSRIGLKPIAVPEKVAVQVRDASIEVKGPGGTLSRKVPQGIGISVDQGQIKVAVQDPAVEGVSALHGLTRNLVAQMVQGVVQPWKKDLEIQGVGYRASKNGQILNLQLGFSHPIDFKVPEKVQFSVDAKQTFVSLQSPDKELLGIVAAQIRSLRPPEPYKGKGIRYHGEHILRKAGKAAGAVGAGGSAGGGAKK